MALLPTAAGGHDTHQKGNAMYRKMLFFVLFLGLAFTLFGRGTRDGSGADDERLVTQGDFVLRGTVLVQYLGRDQNVIIPANLGITEIGEGAFEKSGIRSVSIPEGVERIERAFGDCLELAEVFLPSTLRIIGDHAFFDCSSLVSIRIPSGVTSIGNWAFYGTGLAGISIPAGITTVGDCAFANIRNLVEISVDEQNPAFTSRDGILFSRA